LTSVIWSRKTQVGESAKLTQVEFAMSGQDMEDQFGQELGRGTRTAAVCAQRANDFLLKSTSFTKKVTEPEAVRFFAQDVRFVPRKRLLRWVF